MANLKTDVSRKQSTPKFPKNKHFLPPDTHTYTYCSFCSFSFSSPFLDRQPKVFIPTFHCHSLPRKHVTKIRSISLDTPKRFEVEGICNKIHTPLKFT